MTSIAHGSADPLIQTKSIAARLQSVGVAGYMWGLARLALGWTFLWPFLDKMWGLGHDTTSAKSWVNGGSPTAGFLKGSKGPFSGIYHNIAGEAWVNYAFMGGLLCIGLALLFGIGTRIAAVAGALMLILMWSASLPPASNPFMDDHIIYAIVLLGLAAVGAGSTLGLGSWWTNTSLVRNHKWLS